MRAPEFWHAPPGLIAGLLSPLGVAWDAGSRLRRALAHPYRAPIPVICVGNLVAGGSGKTPVVLSLAQRLTASGTAVHVVTRGYGGRLAGPVLVDPRRHDSEAVGDEAPLLAATVPCWVSADRAAGVAAAAEAGADIVLLDDGFQNPRIVKDYSLLVIDTEYGFGNGRRIPAGPLREPVAPGLARADAIILLGDGAAPPEIRGAAKPVATASLAPLDGARFAGQRVIAFAGIGRPGKFFTTLEALGAALIEAHPFADHYRFTEGDIARLRQAAARADACLVTTAKDWVRLPPAWRTGIEVLEVEICWRNAAAIDHVLADVAQRNTNRHGRDAAGG